MKRTVKNLISILIILCMCGAIYFTMNYAKNNISSLNSSETMPQMSEGGTPPEMPSNNTNTSTNTNLNKNMSEPPAKPDGDTNTSQNGNMGEPPAKPDGDTSTNSNGNMSEPPEMPSGEMPTEFQGTNQSAELTYGYYIAFGAEGLVIAIILMYLILSGFNKKTLKETFSGILIVIIYILAVAVITAGIIFLSIGITKNNFINNNSSNGDKMQNNNNMMNAPGGNNGNSSSVEYSSAKEITEDTTIKNENFSSETADENAITVSGDVDVTIENSTIQKTGDSDGGDNTSFYGTNSAVIAKDGANLTLKNLTVTTNAKGANGVFSYGGSATTNNSSSDGTLVTISDSKITTTADNSGGIMTTGGGTMKASNLTINTSGTSSAAIRTDRGGGTVTVDGGTYTTTGQGSPAVYSTADVTVNNSTLVAKKSEGLIVEGKNSITINNCEVTDTNSSLNGQSTTYKNIFLYQSMSGDASEGKASFTAKDSKITTNKGDTIYVTNTSAVIKLTNNTIVNNDETGNFLRVQKDSWGKSGSNGGNVTLTMSNQKATGNIVIDSISTLDMTMESSSYYEGTINGDNSAKSISLKLDKTSKIKLTGDSYITSLDDSDSSYSNIDFNGYKLYVNGTAIN